MLPGVGSDFGRYRITGRLGRGGMGVVYSAVHRDLDRPVALKLLTPDLSGDDSYRHRFLREARILARLDSPHIVRVYDTGEQDGWLFIATQLINGGDLKQVLDTTGPLPLDAGIELVAQIAEGLAEAHEAGILHRDIKPSNVLLRQRSDGRRQAILCDLGIATLAGADSTLTVGVIGTPTYMSPERHQGEDATVAADVYALGCLLWATITGGPPYQGTPAEIFRGHVHGAVAQLQLDVPHAAALNEVLATAMAKDPADRYATVADMVAALRGIDPFLFRGSYRDDTTDTMRPPPVAEGTIVVPYVESVGLGSPAATRDAGFVGADAVPAAEPSVEIAALPAFEPSVELPPQPPPPALPSLPAPPAAEPSVEVPLPPPVSESSVDLPPPAGLEASVDAPVQDEEPVETAASAWAAGVAAPPAEPAPETVAVPAANAELTSQRPPGTPIPPPPPGAFTPQPPDIPSRGRRRALVLVGVVALAVATVVAAIVVVLAPWAGGDKDADEANDRTSGSPSVTDPTTSETRIDPPPKPDAPKVSANPDYRSVVFDVAAVKAPGTYDVAYERISGNEWVPVDRTFKLKTREGGDKECALVRVTLTGEGGTSSSKPTHECGKSEQKKLNVVESDQDCPQEYQRAGYVCHLYVVTIEGFESGTRQYAQVLALGGTTTCEGRCGQPLDVGPDGRARLKPDLKAYNGNQIEIRIGRLLEDTLIVPG